MQHIDLAAINLISLTDNEQQIKQQVAVKNFVRLNDEQLQDEQISLADTIVNFTVSGKKVNPNNMPQQIQRWLTISANANLIIPCQRCLGALPINIQANNAFRLVDSEQQLQHEEQSCDEELLLISNNFDLHNLIEDELLLSIPLICKHDQCSHKYSVDFTSNKSTTQAKKNPFAALAKLKNNS